MTFANSRIDSSVIYFEMTFGPVHIISICGSSISPIVVRYSDLATVGIALVSQYSVGQKRNSDGLLTKWKISLVIVA